MKVKAEVTLTSEGPLSFSRKHDVPKLEKESYDDYENRTWIDRAHVDEKGQVFIPGMALKMCLHQCSKMLGQKIPGKGSSTYVKHFLSGVHVYDNLVLEGVKKGDLKPISLWCDANGKRGSGSRVLRIFPILPSWKGLATFWIFDMTVTLPVFENTLREAGQFCGLGRFRPSNGGTNGRFTIGPVNWQKIA